MTPDPPRPGDRPGDRSGVRTRARAGAAGPAVALPTQVELLTEIAAAVTIGLSHNRPLPPHPADDAQGTDDARSATALTSEHGRAA
ncbi:hypothetical protein ACQUSR_23060 [Streptomyces sp. P1-3]|uniref:hypothetical protein n=1 Tax=Streptomyces sp. P1-3 TaxID=3421658 RepID=UPI003D367CFE